MKFLKCKFCWNIQDAAHNLHGFHYTTEPLKYQYTTYFGASSTQNLKFVFCYCLFLNFYGLFLSHCFVNPDSPNSILQPQLARSRETRWKPLQQEDHRRMTLRGCLIHFYSFLLDWCERERGSLWLSLVCSSSSSSSHVKWTRREDDFAYIETRGWGCKNAKMQNCKKMQKNAELRNSLAHRSPLCTTRMGNS